ncbi:amidohydrolase [Annulohypoxylon maeteangense]|uniref:amidohydrolase n=1 Tax=Annulohypoxylon maeteangense TaxID=1927788 RepID=UPI002007E47E|nr:amidohydrolase [Annulohypoxylon maeteangense]KAI0884936.1 amidohydrolase [Annulohypoxylon maeteangense]
MTKRTTQQPRPEALPSRIFSTGFGIAIRPPRDDALTNSQLQPSYTIITTDLLIPGSSPPIPSAALVISAKLIIWTGAQSGIPAEYTSAPHVKRYSVPYLMPGLWDCHVHFGGESESEDSSDSYAGFIAEHPAAAGARLTRGCWEAIQRGYTSLRDVAGFGCEVARAIDDGTIVGPNVYSAGACLSQTAGHGDVFSLPAGDVLLNLGVASISAGQFGTGMSVIVDGVDECRRAVRLQIRRGARCIKVLASGGVMSRDDNPLYAQFSPEELKCIVEEATRQNRAVAAHVHGKPGILAAVEAGVTTVEHVSFADQECVDLIKEKGTVWIATRTIVDMLLQSGGKGLSRQQWEKAQLCGKNHLAAYKLAIEAGVPIALGTDTPPGFNMAMELDYAVQAGLSNLEAIKAATANGPLSVGGQAPKTGQLKVGYEADVLGLLENPVEDVKILQEKANIGWVWKGGKILKGPGVGPWGEEL